MRYKTQKLVQQALSAKIITFDYNAEDLAAAKEYLKDILFDVIDDELIVDSGFQRNPKTGKDKKGYSIVVPTGSFMFVGKKVYFSSSQDEKLIADEHEAEKLLACIDSLHGVRH